MNPTILDPAFPQYDDAKHSSQRPSKKRNRPTLSCNHCRIRKLKCNRTHPCESCVKTGDAETCSFSLQASHEESQLPTDQRNFEGLKARIDRLEGLLVSVVTKDGVQHTQLAPHRELSSSIELESLVYQSDGQIAIQENTEKANGIEVDQLSPTFGVMQVDPKKGKSLYLGGAHWISIMCEIQEFRTYLEKNNEELQRNAIATHASSLDIANGASSLLCGTSNPKGRNELLSQIPQREVVDELVTQYFSFNRVGYQFLHEPTFRNEYSRFWEDPESASTTWLGLLFSLMQVAELSYTVTRNKRSNTTASSAALYKRGLIECLVAAGYTSPVTYTLEALMLYILADWMISQDAGIEISLVLGIVIRLAMRMGMHRDSSVHPEITPFQGEMRRRLWASIRIMDILYSFQISLPATIRSSDCTTAPPRNIYSSEFGPDTVELPHARDSSEPTEISITITKCRLILILGKVLVLAESHEIITHDEVLKYEQELDEAKFLIPPHLQITGHFEKLTLASKPLLFGCIGLDRIYQLGHCILHRRFLVKARREPEFLQYRASCVDAALTILNHQATVYLECDLIYPQNVRTRHMVTHTTHDFFVAGMVIALDLHYGFEYEPFTPSANDVSLWGFDRRSEMIAALEVSNEFWRISKDDSIEAAKANGIFSFAVRNAKEALWKIEAQNGSMPGAPGQMITKSSHSTASLSSVIGKGGEMADIDFDLWNNFDIETQNFGSFFQ